MNKVPFTMLPPHATECLSPSLGSPVTGDATTGLAWHAFPALPTPLAGLAAGVSRGRLVVAGGNNFPAAPPWQGGRRQYYRAIWTFDIGRRGWQPAATQLPAAVAYATCAGFGDDIIVAGGQNENGATACVFRLTTTEADVSIHELAPLPLGLFHGASAAVGRWLFLAGGLSAPDGESLRRCWAGEYREHARDIVWTEVPPWPGVGRHLAVAGTDGRSFFIFSGMRNVASPGGVVVHRPYLTDAYVYDFARHPGDGRWRQLADLPQPAAGAPAQAVFASCRSQLCILGGLAGDDAGIPPQHYPPFPNRLSVYSIAANRWHLLHDAMPAAIPRVTTPVIPWRDGWFLAGGESGPGRRTSSVYNIVSGTIGATGSRTSVIS